MASLISRAFANATQEERPAFVAYIVAGYPSPKVAVDVLLALEKGGVDVIELGIPFSDPLADGPTIQAAHTVALANNIDIDSCIRIVSEARKRGLKIPVLFMGYYNPIMQYGEEELVYRCAEEGIDGYIVVDLPPHEAMSFRALCKEAGLSYIPLVTPATTEERIKNLVQIADSFIYVVSRSGVTGARKSLDNHLSDLLARVKKYTNLPLAVGFGVNTHEHFKDVGAMADGVVIGSQFITVMRNVHPGKAAKAARAYAEETSGRSINDIKREKPLSRRRISSFKTLPESQPLLPGWFGEYGGQYIAEALHGAMAELEKTYAQCSASPEFWEEFRSFYPFMGRQTPMHFASRLSKKCRGARIFLKREDLCYTGAHTINNAIGQALLAKRLKKTRIIADTCTGQNGISVAIVCARLALKCVIYMGSEDMKQWKNEVFRIQMLGAQVIPVSAGSGRYKDAINEAVRDSLSNLQNTYYLVGSPIGCHPFPTMVRDFQRVIGDETKSQMLELTNKLPDAVIASVGSGSNAIGMFYPFIYDEKVRIIGAEAAGKGLDTTAHAATLTVGSPGVLHGAKTYVLQDTSGQIMDTYSIAPGLSYPAVGPELAWLKESERAEYYGVTDVQAIEAFRNLVRLEGIIPSLESAHAVYQAMQLASKMTTSHQIVVCITGRGEKDVHIVADAISKLEL
ncbi:tryptophan synthase [Coemansia reversa NRRL 1564]|uniref:Tryptophan synthase n=1 Tax=Coemansia reversa (strain ATCC 12441 / NRRL 1564) TaxID=763665 RepID=A0A2G5BA98_COERN|nr:tryptophan synthase [Coemansia reversa NRRL 1564]|eukprot:PIA15939.1 tryptophan synthase [Coemansia reversa NRRL 1564]